MATNRGLMPAERDASSKTEVPLQLNRSTTKTYHQSVFWRTMVNLVLWYKILAWAALNQVCNA